jgi:hypothetical protein
MVSAGSPSERSTDDVIDQLKEILAANVSGNAQLVAHFNDLVRDISKEMGSGRRPDPAELLSRWLDFNLASYSVVSKQSVALLDGLLEVARSTLIPSPLPARVVADEQRVELRLSGRPGEKVSTGFMIENQFDRQLEVTFECDDLTTDAGQSVSRSHVLFEPTTLTIPAHEQAVGQVAVKIDRRFAAGTSYRTTIRLLGFPAKELDLFVSVLPRQEPDAARQPRRKPARAAKGRPRAAS